MPAARLRVLVRLGAIASAFSACGPRATGVCGDGVCQPDESSATCPADCPDAPACGDGTCNPPVESCGNCATDCGECPGFCGDQVCDAPLEGCDNCATDCGSCPPACGDGVCAVAESCASCPADCLCGPGCGDGACAPAGGETCSNCPSDCTCGTATCQEAYACGEACGPDFGCVNNCYASACAAGQEQGAPLIACGTMTCLSSCLSGLGDAACMACVLSMCAVEYAACADTC